MTYEQKKMKVFYIIYHINSKKGLLSMYMIYEHIIPRSKFFHGTSGWPQTVLSQPSRAETMGRMLHIQSLSALSKREGGIRGI